ncbi:DUF4198 domain-containing protein [Acidovorax sp. HDW3]|uniref:DUF4198 domain-containing protein n=1 Tax=Acidovorax sp. HDW3 TaxID=2714923 RepID=UPI00140D4480|nr:DUF4198 domain-containing protein [Acidovorax sp. HDW3]QIL43341.1 DUF4198 domain-containing protein [Acidovorax sp. HDW3]
MPIPSRFASLAVALLTLGTTAAHAHQVWIENADGQARLHFGEFHMNLRETSPGSLDKFLAAPTLEQRSSAGSTQLPSTLGKDAFVASPQADAQTLFATAPYPVIDRSKRNLPAMLWVPAARWVAQAAQAVAPHAKALDLVPTGKPGEFKAVFNGAPLSKVVVEMVAPSGWSLSQHSGEDGTVTFALPWKGQYVAEVKHTDKTPGEAHGKPYAEASYVTTLSFVQKDGMASPALPEPPAKGH